MSPERTAAQPTAVIPRDAAPLSISGDGEASWKNRILVPTVIGGVIGGGWGLISKHRKALGAANVCAMYATNSAIVAGSYSGIREFVRNTRATESNDLVNSAIGGFATGALLGRLQGGPRGAFRYSIIFGVIGPIFDLAIHQLYPLVRDVLISGWQLPEWSPIQVLDEEALAAKRVREQKLYTQKTLSEDLIKDKP